MCQKEAGGRQDWQMASQGPPYYYFIGYSCFFGGRGGKKGGDTSRGLGMHAPPFWMDADAQVGVKRPWTTSYRRRGSDSLCDCITRKMNPYSTLFSSSRILETNQGAIYLLNSFEHFDQFMC